MARIRTIKPEYFRHFELFKAEKETGLPLRVAFAGLWTAADREGRFRWRPEQLKLDCLPYDDVDFSRVLDALESHGFIQQYVVDEERFGRVPSWQKHQIVNVREAKSCLPEPACTETHVHAHVENVHAPETHMHACAENARNISASLRKQILDRDGNKCLRCGATNDLTIDHIFPLSIGGSHAWQNLRTLCRRCNSSRPVGGEALGKDLALDGLSRDDMKRMCMHVHARGEQEQEQEGEREEVRKNAPNGACGSVVDLQQSVPPTPTPPVQVSPRRKKEPELGPELSPEDLFWDRVAECSRVGIPRSRLGQLAKIFDGDFEAANVVVAQALRAKAPGAYLGKVVSEHSEKSHRARAGPDPDMPPHLTDWAAGRQIIKLPDGRWRIENEIYDAKGEQVGW